MQISDCTRLPEPDSEGYFARSSFEPVVHVAEGAQQAEARFAEVESSV